MVDKFESSHFMLAVANHMQYDEDTIFNENNVTLYLSELEEYISCFITFLAQREKNPDAPISALSLDNMANKDFEKATGAIEVPSAHDFAGIDDETAEGDDVVTNPKDLYRKYEELASKGYLDETKKSNGHGVGQGRK
jgi:hypothetical protein